MTIAGWNSLFFFYPLCFVGYICSTMSSSRCFGGSGERNCWKCALTVSLNAILKVPPLFPLTNAFFFISRGAFLVFRSRVHESLRRLCGAKKTKQVLSHILDHILRHPLHSPPPPPLHKRPTLPMPIITKEKNNSSVSHAARCNKFWLQRKGSDGAWTGGTIEETWINQRGDSHTWSFYFNAVRSQRWDLWQLALTHIGMSVSANKHREEMHDFFLAFCILGLILLRQLWCDHFITKCLQVFA